MCEGTYPVQESWRSSVSTEPGGAAERTQPESAADPLSSSGFALDLREGTILKKKPTKKAKLGRRLWGGVQRNVAASTEFRLVELPTTTLLCSSEAELRRQEAQNAFMTLLFTDPGEESPAQASADNNRRESRDTALAPRLR